MIADPVVRNRGTIGGSLAHGDPAADLTTAFLAYDGTLTATGPDGVREVGAGEFFQDYMTTALSEDEVITEVRMPRLEGWGFGYEKFTRRAEDWAMVGVVALVKKAGDGSCEDVRIAMTNMGSTPLRATAAEEALKLDPRSVPALQLKIHLLSERLGRSEEALDLLDRAVDWVSRHRRIWADRYDRLDDALATLSAHQEPAT